MRMLVITAVILTAAGTTWTKQPTPPAAKKSASTGFAEKVIKSLGQDFKPLIEKQPNGRIDWTRRRIVATGTAKARSAGQRDVAAARRAAKLAAARNALSIIKDLHLAAGGRIDKAKEKKLSAEALLKKLDEVSSTVDRSGKIVTSRVELPFYGPKGIIKLLGVSFRRTGQRWNWPEPLGVGAAADAIVIDARETGFAPGLGVMIVTNDGRGVLGPADVKPGDRISRPMAVYVEMKITGVRKDAKSFILRPLGRAKIVTGQAGRVEKELAKAVKKRFANPLILNAQRTTSPGTIMLSPSAVKELHLHGEARKLFRQGKVVIVTDGPKQMEK